MLRFEIVASWQLAWRKIAPLYKLQAVETISAEDQIHGMEAVLDEKLCRILMESHKLFVILVYDTHDVIGYAIVALLPPFPFANLLVGNITHRFLLNSYRKKGIGRKLLDFIENFAKQQGAKALLVGERSHLEYSKLSPEWKSLELTRIKWLARAKEV